MAVVTLKSHKAKIAKRVIEVFEFFGSVKQPATVMDIARRCGRPQSSTSELLSSLMEMGVRYKDSVARAFTPTPRLATLGVSAQHEIIRDSRLFNFKDRLAEKTRKTITLFGIVGKHVQIFRWIPSPNPLAREINCGSSELLSNSIAGQLLLSTLPVQQARGMVWRLNAEADKEHKFDHSELVKSVENFRPVGHATGDSSFIPGVKMSAVVLPQDMEDHPLGLSILYSEENMHETNVLVGTLKHGMNHLFRSDVNDIDHRTQLARAV